MSPATLSTAWVQLLLVSAAAFGGAYARTMVGPFQESIRLGLSLSDNQMALLQGPALAMPLVICAIPLGFATDRYSRVRLLTGFAICETVGTVCTALASNFIQLTLSRCLVGLAALAVNPVALSVIADLYQPSQRGRALMIMAIGQFVGMAGAFAIGGELLSFASGTVGWRFAMLWATVGFLPVLLANAVMAEPRRTDGPGVRLQNRAVWSELWRYRTAIAPVLVGVVVTEMTITSVLTWTAPTLSRRFGSPPDRVGLVMAAIVVVSGLMGPAVGGIVADWCQRSGGLSRTVSVLVVMTVLSAPAALFPLLPGLFYATASVTVYMMMISAIAVVGTALFTIVIPAEIRGMCTAILAAGGTLAYAVAPMLVSTLSTAMGGPPMVAESVAAISLLLSLISGVIFSLALRCRPIIATG